MKNYCLLSLLLLTLNISRAQKIIIKNPTTGDKIQVASHDFEKEMTWNDALTACSELGKGWRLPTKSEFELIYKELYQKGDGNFKSGNFAYWTKSECGNNFSYRFFFDKYGEAICAEKKFTYYVRAIRTL